MTEVKKVEFPFNETARGAARGEVEMAQVISELGELSSAAMLDPEDIRSKASLRSKLSRVARGIEAEHGGSLEGLAVVDAISDANFELSTAIVGGQVSRLQESHRQIDLALEHALIERASELGVAVEELSSTDVREISISIRGY